MVRAMQRCASRPAPGGAANQGDDGGLARRTLAGAGRWREASGRAREAQFRLSKIGPAAAGPEGDSAAQEVKKWCPGRRRLAGGAQALIFQLAQLRQLLATGFFYSKTGKWHNCAPWVLQKYQGRQGPFRRLCSPVFGPDWASSGRCAGRPRNGAARPVSGRPFCSVVPIASGADRRVREWWLRRWAAAG